MRKLFLTYVIFCTLILLSNTIVYAGGTSKSSQSKIAALYSKKIMTGGVIVAANQSKNDTTFSFRRTLADTSKPNRIIGIRESSGGLYLLEMDVAENQQNLQIGIYNLLGKKVLDVHQGTEYSGKSKLFDMNVQGIPNGIYVCIAQGDNFRLAEKFYISR